MTPQELHQTLDHWPWLRPLDRAFVRFLSDLDRQASPHALLAAALASYQLGRGHICLDLEATLTDPEATLAIPAASGTPEAALPGLAAVLRGMTLADWRQNLIASGWVHDGDGNTPLVLHGSRLYLRRYWHSERQVAARIMARVTAAPAEPAGLRATLDQLFPRTGPADDIDWQRIACAIAARRPLTVITGGPGTGKTTTVVKLLALLQSAAAEDQSLRIRLTAPTGKAAARLTESIGGALENRPELQPFRSMIPTEATTLHRLLGSRPGTRHFRHDWSNPLHADLVVMDEASMIDLEMMAALLDALPDQARLVLLGDKDQLASVEAGSVLGDLCRNVSRAAYSAETVTWLREVTGEKLAVTETGNDALIQQIVELRFSRRFGEGSGIGRLARAVNAGREDEVRALLGAESIPPDLAYLPLQGPEDRQLESLAVLGRKGGAASGYAPYLRMLRETRPAPNGDGGEFDAWAKRVLEEFDRFQLLCALREGSWGVKGLNRRIEADLHARGLIERPYGWYEGRPVLVTRNDYRLGLMNGDIGIALRFPPAADAGGPLVLRVVFPQPDGALRRVLPSRLTEAETVFAMTVHKSQGSEFDHVALVLPDTRVPVLTRELLYTGITRARTCFSLLVPEPAVIGHAVRTQVKRVTGLSELLSGSNVSADT